MLIHSHLFFRNMLGCYNLDLLNLKYSQRCSLYTNLLVNTRIPIISNHKFSLLTSKHLKGGKETKMDVLVMENLLYRRNIRRLYDLKGSSRSRYNPDTSGSNKVLLDQNLIEAMPTSPIFVGNKAKRLLERAVWNDTAFLAVSLMPFTSSILYILVFRCTFMDFLATFFSFFASIMMLGGRTYD